MVRTNDPARMPDFVRLLRQVEQRNDFFSYEDPYFDAIAQELLVSGDASLYFATGGEVDAAAALVFDFGPTRYYAFGATDTESRKLMPAPPLVWQAILDARREGRDRFDFWGAAPPDAGARPPVGRHHRVQARLRRRARDLRRHLGADRAPARCAAVRLAARGARR